MLTSDFSYDLPTELIAQQPLARRGASRMLVVDGTTGKYTDSVFDKIAALVQPGDLLVLNDTRVIPARLYGHKDTGGSVEVLVERVLDDHRVLAHVRASRAPRTGTRIELDNGASLAVTGRHDDLFELALAGTTGADTVMALLEAAGHMPLPPYIERDDSSGDRERYQTVYARRPGAVAAPTAGLHFEPEVLAGLEASGVELAWVTLHVGAGTFQPVRATHLAGHRMHAEILAVDARVCAQVQATRQRGGRVVAVGTTSVRCLESAAASGALQPLAGETDLFIYPGYEYRVVDALLTNFHLPESTLLMLVCAFAGYDTVMAAYRHAVAARYRFFSYGDAMFLRRA